MDSFHPTGHQDIPGTPPSITRGIEMGIGMISQSQTQSPVELSSSSTPSTPQVNRVNGVGMWKAWTRSFDTPMLALLDLFDNAVDASWTLVDGQDQDQAIKPKIHVQLDAIGQHGVVMRNNCRHTIPHIKQVLEVYKSSKGNSAIGENGIGVKHACASLCQLSFLLTKTADHYSMGILMEGLQQEQGVVLPSCQWEFEDNLEVQLRTKAEQEPDSWGRALEQYGDGVVEDGIDRILQHFSEMTKGDAWKDCPNMFSVVLTQLRHIALGAEDDEDSAMMHMHDLEDNSQDRSLNLLGELRDKLPQLYIHMHPLQVSVQHQVIHSLYWEKRLVELTQFEIALNQTQSWSKDVFTCEHGQPPYKHKTIRFFAGFDPYRSTDQRSTKTAQQLKRQQQKHQNTKSKTAATQGGRLEKNTSALRVYMYSRESGRLIKVYNDPRSQLGINAGSTDFKQGLTILLDDYNGTLPLNPTKQDTAFGHSAHGLTHWDNIMEWTAAITHFYWNFHLERMGGLKSKLTAAVLNSEAALQEVFGDEGGGGGQEGDDLLAPLSHGEFITVNNLKWKTPEWRGQKKLRTSIRQRESAVPVPGQHVVVRLMVPPVASAASSPGAPRKKSARKEIAKASRSTKRSRQAGEISYNEDDLQPDFVGDGYDEQQPGGGSLRNGNSYTAEANTELERTLENREATIAKLYLEVKQRETQLEQAENERNHYKAKAAREEQFNHKLNDKVNKKRSTNLKLHDQIKEVQQELENSKQELKDINYQMERLKDRAKQPSAPMNESEESAKLRKELQFAKSQSSFYKEQVQKKEERIDNLKKGMESLQDENKLYEKQIGQLQDYQEDLI